MTLLSQDEIASQLGELDGWTLEEKAISRKHSFKDFREAIAFLVHLAFYAEEDDHHPDLTINYRHVNFSLSTHSEGGLTAKDFKLAKTIDTLLAT